MADIFTSTYKVGIGDINYGGHLGNDKALVIFQDARVQFLQSIDCSEMDIGKGCGIIMVESGVRYLHEIFVHEELEISIVVSEIRPKKFVLNYVVLRKSDEQKVLSGSTSFLSFNYQARKVSALPAAFKEKLQPYKQES